VYSSTFQHPPSQADVLGAACIIFWTLTSIALIKYVAIVLHADDDGEGKTTVTSSSDKLHLLQVHVHFQYSSDFVKKQGGCRHMMIVRGSKAMGQYSILMCLKRPPAFLSRGPRWAAERGNKLCSVLTQYSFHV
jgi:hypothetical protein